MGEQMPLNFKDVFGALKGDNTLLSTFRVSMNTWAVSHLTEMVVEEWLDEDKSVEI